MSYELAAQNRAADGPKLSELRTNLLLPGILYGEGLKENKNLQMKMQDFTRIYQEAGQSQVIELSVENEKEPFHVLVKEVQIDPVTRDFIHADFKAIDINKPVEIEVPLKYTGEAPAVKSSGGSLIKNHDTLLCRCLPKDLIKFIEVPLASLATFDDVILVSSLNVPESIEVLLDENELIATVVPPFVEAAPVEATAAAEGEAAAEGGAAPAEGAKEGEEKKEEGK